MSDRTCTIDSCKNKFVARGMCGKHYQRFRTSEDFQLIPRRYGCDVEGCDRDHYGKGFCEKHWDRWRKHGDPKKVSYIRTSSAEESFALRTEWQGDCLVWTGGTSHVTGEGYGKLRVNGVKTPAHRYAWERVNGPIPDGMYIDHKCWNPTCVNVEHLRLATPGENTSYLSGPNKDNASTGIRNVYPNWNRWMVVIRKSGTPHYFGTFDTIEEAAEVAELARKRLFGEFAGKG